MKVSVLLFLLTFGLMTSGLNVVTLRYCCGLGTNYASSSLECDSFQPPVTGVRKSDESSCLRSMQVCCKNQKQELECGAGISEAKSGTCAGSGDKKDCCDACQLGRETAKTQKACQDGVGLGNPFDKAFTDCCNEILNAPSTSTSTTTTQKATTTKASDTFNSQPPIDNICDIGDICAQICIPTDDSYRCGCNKGFTLMADGVSCKPEKRALKKGDRCSISNPCDHDCLDTGVAIKCSCRDGYELAKDKHTCIDIDECALDTHECTASEECVNEEGSYYCEDLNIEADLKSDPNLDVKCPAGYKFNYDKLVCDDIDECEIGLTCVRPKVCINTIGSFKCEGEDVPQCPPGFHYKSAIETCDDIDECISGDNDCNKESQVCLNTKGNYTCVDKVSKTTCPPGFKKNQLTQNCDDINECVENDHPCGPGEECVNEPGGHNCITKTPDSKKYNFPLKPPYEPALPPNPSDLERERTTSSTSTSTSIIPKSTTTTSTTTTSTTPKPRPVSCPRGYRATRTNTCADIDECSEDAQACDSTQECFNSPGSYICMCKSGYTKDHQTGACADINECQVGTNDCTIGQRCDNTIGSYLCARVISCGTGYTLNYASNVCEDDDECVLGTHTCNSLGPNFRCRNTLGSYRCDPLRQTPRSQIFPIPALGTSPSSMPQVGTTVYRSSAAPEVFQSSIAQSVPSQASPSVYRSPESPALSSSAIAQPVPSQVAPSVFRIPAPPVAPQIYHKPVVPLAVPTPVVPQVLTTPFSTRNHPIFSGPRKQCLPGYFMNARGTCEDINECDSNPCRRGQKCLNFNGRFQCVSLVQCKIGYELDESGETCVDVNECSRGTHKCKPTQICKNGNGFYTCECPPGHHIDPATQRCEDIDECKFYRACSINAECINTVGSYKCHCKEGFRGKGNFCEDVDECKEHSQLCEHSCVNIWGSYRCACKPGFVLNNDNRTCTDIDECDRFKDKRLCIGTCENIPGSYKCTCPNGYHLGSDGRTCADIDECQQNVCRRPDDVCLNTRGHYKCYTISCPPQYYRDPQHKGRCKRSQSACDPRDVQCMLLPDQYTYNYISIASNLPITGDNSILLFQINGPKWAVSRVEFSMKVVNVIAPFGVDKVNDRYFKTVKPEYNSMHLYMVRSIIGPQEVELKVEMRLFQGSVMLGTTASHIFIVVSQYAF